MRPIKHLLRLMTDQREPAQAERPAPAWRKAGSGAAVQPCEAKVLGSLAHGPQTSYEVSMSCGLGHKHVMVLMTTLQRLGHVVDSGLRGVPGPKGIAPAMWRLA